MNEKLQILKRTLNPAALADTPSPEVSAALEQEILRLSKILNANNPFPPPSEEMFFVTAETTGVPDKESDWD